MVSSRNKTVETSSEMAGHHTETTPNRAGERVDLPITGMTCAACARLIERRLSKTPGVKRAGVNFATSRATGVSQLIETVKGAGCK